MVSLVFPTVLSHVAVFEAPVLCTDRCSREFIFHIAELMLGNLYRCSVVMNNPRAALIIFMNNGSYIKSPLFQAEIISIIIKQNKLL